MLTKSFRSSVDYLKVQHPSSFCKLHSAERTCILLKEVAFRIPPVVTDPLKSSVDATVKKTIDDWSLVVKQWNQKHHSSLSGQSGGNASVGSGSQQQSRAQELRTGSRPVFLPGEKKIDVSHNHIFSDDCVIPIEQFEGGNECLCCASCHFHPTV